MVQDAHATLGLPPSEVRDLPSLLLEEGAKGALLMLRRDCFNNKWVSQNASTFQLRLAKSQEAISLTVVSNEMKPICFQNYCAGA